MCALGTNVEIPSSLGNIRDDGLNPLINACGELEASHGDSLVVWGFFHSIRARSRRPMDKEIC